MNDSLPSLRIPSPPDPADVTLRRLSINGSELDGTLSQEWVTRPHTSAST